VGGLPRLRRLRWLSPGAWGTIFLLDWGKLWFWLDGSPRAPGVPSFPLFGENSDGGVGSGSPVTSQSDSLTSAQAGSLGFGTVHPALPRLSLGQVLVPPDPVLAEPLECPEMLPPAFPLEMLPPALPPLPGVSRDVAPGIASTPWSV